MNKIKFSHQYTKLGTIVDGDKALLCGVFNVNLEDLPKQLIGYDTFYVDGSKRGHYPLPKKGKYLLLLFLFHAVAPDGEPMYGISTLFTTLRRWTPRKEEYYKSKVGEYFEVVIE